MFRKKTNILTDEKTIDELLERGISQIYPTKEKLKDELISGKCLKIYFGADATGPNLHLGHTKNLILVEKLRKLGHEIMILFGDFTAKIGDPTDKSAARVRLTDAQVNENLKSWKKQVQKVVDINNKQNPVKFVRNSQWLSKMKFDEVVDLASNFTVQQMIERDMFEKRLKDGKPIYVHEFFYPLMQGYDSVALDVDVEIGGTDQTFNMLAGRTLLSKLKNKEKYVIAGYLLEDPETGKKLMSKSEGDAIYLNDSSVDMFGKTMALLDSAIIPMLIGVTNIPMEQINHISAELVNGANPRDAKILLAKEIVKIYHGEKAADEAEKNFIETFSKKESMSDDAPEVVVESGSLLSEIVIESDICQSKSEFRRLVTNGAITDLKTGEKISDPNYSTKDDLDLKIGKKNFLKVRIK
jgi:tyrosyl-tRNA synthetase